MALTQGIVDSFLSELAIGTHNFAAAGGDTFKMALYLSSATLGAATTVYTATGEITGTGYSAGGIALTNVQPSVSDSTLILTFASPITWSASQLTARGALIYNSSKANKAVAVLDFGADKTMTNFAVTLPVATSSAALLRLAVSQ